MTPDTAPRRPGITPYLVAGAVALLGILIAAVVLIVGIRSWIGDFPELGTSFRAEERVRAPVTAGQTQLVYISPESSVSRFDCVAKVDGTELSVIEPTYTFTFFSGGRTWKAGYEITGDVTGTADVRCLGPARELLALGPKPDNGALVTKLIGTILGGLCTGLTGIVAGVVIAVVALRRRRAMSVH